MRSPVPSRFEGFCVAARTLQPMTFADRELSVERPVLTRLERHRDVARTFL